MTIQEIGSIGEAIGAVAVVVSLVYLAIQIRRSSAIERARAEQTLHDTFHSYAWDLAQDEKWMRLLPAGLADWEALSDMDKVLFNQLMLPFLANLANGIQMRSKGLLDEAALTAMADNMLSCIVMSGGSAWWEETKASIHPEVVAHLESRLGDPGTLPPSFGALFPFHMRLVS